MRLPSPRAVSPSNYSQPHSSDLSDSTCTEIELVEPPYQRDSRFHGVAYDFDPATSASTDSSSKPSRDRLLDSRTAGSATSDTSLTSSVQLHLHSPIQSLASKCSYTSHSKQALTMEQSLTSTPHTWVQPRAAAVCS
jgi:hypothetical protein